MKSRRYLFTQESLETSVTERLSTMLIRTRCGRETRRRCELRLELELELEL